MERGVTSCHRGRGEAAAPLCTIKGHCAFLAAPWGTKSYHHWEIPCLEGAQDTCSGAGTMGAKGLGGSPSSQASVTPVQRDDSSTLALLQGITFVQRPRTRRGLSPGIQWHTGLLLHPDSPT